MSDTTITDYAAAKEAAQKARENLEQRAVELKAQLAEIKRLLGRTRKVKNGPIQKRAKKAKTEEATA